MANKYYDLVEQTSTTTGVSGYVMSTTPVGRRPFSVVTNGAKIPYGAVDDVGGFEFGIGTWNAGTSTLARTLILSSSDSNTAVSWDAGERRVYITPYAAMMGMATVRHSIGQDNDTPGSGDDENDGYGVGSFYVNTYGEAFMCVDPTSGQAVWKKVPVGGLGPDEWGIVEVPEDSVLSFYGAAGALPDTVPAMGTMSMPCYGCYEIKGSMGVMTSDAVPSRFEYNIHDAEVDITPFLDTGGLHFDATVVAASQNDRKIWKLSFGSTLVETAGDFALGTITKTEVEATAGAAAWDVTPSIVETSEGYALALDATGSAATYVNWLASYTLLLVNRPAF